MNSSITIQFSNRSTRENIWVKLIQVGTEEDPTLNQAAELLDSLFEITPCDEDQEPETEVITEEEFQENASVALKLPVCDVTFEKDFVCQVKVIRSDNSIPYVLNLTNGQLQKTVVTTELIERNFVVENTDNFQLDYPVLESAEFYWRNTPMSEDGPVYNPPVISYTTDGVLSWGQELTGVISAKYYTEYDLVDVLVFNDNGNIGESEAICFYSKSTDVITLTFPEDLAEDLRYKSGYCRSNVDRMPEEEKPVWEEIETKYYCECSGEYSHSVYSDPPTEEQKLTHIYPGISKVVNGGYINCGETTGDINDLEFYYQTCCNYPVFVLPNCQYLYRKNDGGQSLSEEGQSSYISQYGDKVRFTPVSPKDGDCGTKIFKQIKNQRNCCDEVPQLFWDYDFNPDVVADNSSVLIRVGPPLTVATAVQWTIYGSGFYLNEARNQRTIITSSEYVRVYTDNACGTALIYADDGCSSTSGEIRSTNGRWVDVPDEEVTPMMIPADSIIYRTTIPVCGSLHTFQGTQGRYRAQQNYWIQGDVENAYSSYASGPGPACAQVTTDWEAMAEAVREALFCWRPGEMEVVSTQGLASLIPPPDPLYPDIYYWYIYIDSNLQEEYRLGYNSWGQVHSYYLTEYSPQWFCFTRAYVFAPQCTGTSCVSGFTLQEWVC